MAQPTTNPKIEELRFRLKTDPKNRIFYPLAEELRKVGQLGEAEQVLRAGLAFHPTYLSAWVSRGFRDRLRFGRGRERRRGRRRIQLGVEALDDRVDLLVAGHERLNELVLLDGFDLFAEGEIGVAEQPCCDDVARVEQE